jgi:hypothetical protein
MFQVANYRRGGRKRNGHQEEKRRVIGHTACANQRQLLIVRKLFNNSVFG